MIYLVRLMPLWPFQDCSFSLLFERRTSCEILTVLIFLTPRFLSSAGWNSHPLHHRRGWAADPASSLHWPGGLQSILHSVPKRLCWNKRGTSNLRQLSICLPCPEQVFPNCSDKNIGRLQRGRNGGTERLCHCLQTGQEICGGAKNRTEVLGFCTSTTRPFLSSSQIVSPMMSLPQWLARKVLHYANQLLSGAGWRPNTSPQMFSQPPKIDLRAAHVDCNHDYFL